MGCYYQNKKSQNEKPYKTSENSKKEETLQQNVNKKEFENVGTEDSKLDDEENKKKESEPKKKENMIKDFKKLESKEKILRHKSSPNVDTEKILESLEKTKQIIHNIEEEIEEDTLNYKRSEKIMKIVAELEKVLQPHDKTNDN